MDSGNLFVPVSEHHGLIRDARSNSIINTDKQAYESAVKAKQVRRQLHSDICMLKKQVSLLEQRLSQLEQIIKSNNK